MFDKVDGFIRDFDKTKYLSPFHSEKYKVIFNMLRYIINLIFMERLNLIQMMIHS